MFESVTPPSSSNEPARAPSPPATPLEIHTMPERFMGSGKGIPTGAPKPKGSGRKLIIAIGIVVVVLLGAAAALMFTNVLNKNAANTNNTNLVTNSTVNTNSNSNLNSNANQNSNTNGNVNTAGNLNDNGNLNANSNSNANQNTNANLNSNPQTKSSLDTDKDGLTDAEELVFGTNPSSADSDGDSFQDGSEVKMGYNPKGSGKIAASSLVITYTNQSYGASVLYPRGWSIVNRSVTEEIFSNPAGDESVTLSVYDNPARLTAKQWYLQQAGTSITTSSLVDVATWDLKSTGILSPDGLAYYFANGGQVYVISYSYGLKPAVDNRTTFEMIARSLTVEPSKVNLNTNSATNLNGNANSNLNTNAVTNLNTNVNTNSNGNLNTNTQPLL